MTLENSKPGEDSNIVQEPRGRERPPPKRATPTSRGAIRRSIAGLLKHPVLTLLGLLTSVAAGGFACGFKLGELESAQKALDQAEKDRDTRNKLDDSLRDSERTLKDLKKNYDSLAPIVINSEAFFDLSKKLVGRNAFDAAIEANKTGLVSVDNWVVSNHPALGWKMVKENECDALAALRGLVVPFGKNREIELISPNGVSNESAFVAVQSFTEQEWKDYALELFDAIAGMPIISRGPPDAMKVNPIAALTGLLGLFGLRNTFRERATEDMILVGKVLCYVILKNPSVEFSIQRVEVTEHIIHVEIVEWPEKEGAKSESGVLNRFLLVRSRRYVGIIEGRCPRSSSSKARQDVDSWFKELVMNRDGD
jgi:hypothetical protein